MSNARRRINSTGRKRIGRECIEISLLETKLDEPRKARISLNLENLGFPGNALVVLEAYHRSSGKRFNLGRVSALKVSEELNLSEVDRSGSILFRLKVVDSEVEPGKLLGSAERLKPKGEDDGEGRRTIFPIKYEDLRHDVWKVDTVYGDRPILVVNKRIPGFDQRLLKSALVRAILLPAALRFVLKELVKDDHTGQDDDEVGWKEEWFEYCQKELGMEKDPREFSMDSKDNEKEEWIDDAVARFCENHKFVDKITDSSEEVDD